MKMDSQQRVACDTEDDFYAQLRRSVDEFAAQVKNDPSPRAAICVYDNGEQVQLQELGSRKSIARLKMSLLDHVVAAASAEPNTKVFRINLIGVGIGLFGAGILVGMWLH